MNLPFLYLFVQLMTLHVLVEDVSTYIKTKSKKFCKYFICNVKEVDVWFGKGVLIRRENNKIK